MEGKPVLILVLICLFHIAAFNTVEAQLSLDVLGYGPDQPLTIDNCIEIALTGNPAHQKFKTNISLSNSNVLAAYGNFLPQLTGGYSLTDDQYYNATYQWPDGSIVARPVELPLPADTTLSFNDLNGNGQLDQGEIVALITPESSMRLDPSEGRRRYSYGYLQLSQTLFAGGRNLFTLRSARDSQKASEFSLDRDRQLLSYNISQAYFNVLATQQLLELSKRVLDQRKEQFKLAKARYDVGSVTKLDVMQAEIDLGNQENEVLLSEQELTIARMDLNKLMGVYLDESYTVIDDSVLFAPTLDTRELVSRALAHRPDLQQLESELASYDNAVMAERGSYLPTIAFQLNYTTDELDNTKWSFSPVNHDTRFGFNMTWDFFSGFSRENRIRQAQVSSQNTRYDIMDKKLSVEKEVKEAILNLERIYSQSLITRKNRELARENLTLERERYRLGSASLLDLRTAQVTYIQAESDHISKMLEFRTTLSQLEYATGLDIEEGEIGGKL